MKNDEKCPACKNSRHALLEKNYLKCKKCKSLYLRADIPNEPDYFNEFYGATIPLD